ncbi:serine-rich adhesin for platelets isoform X3 [Octopus sinensis]|uniref:Serine-rich adhesin for platelets isoform X3 n=1 Tax=Octopus sinensis TaxID=2607531 RepID=A0A6P7SP85_9MOLL|nr:serine-rich adhesin for platelets isoform X3 [Octopus sinensis]
MLLSILSVLTAVSTCIIPASGQQTCQTEILQNSTVDIDKYLNNELHILATFATLPPDALSNCILRCCNQSNCSLAIHNATDNHTCTLIHCVSEDACKPIPSDGSEMVKTIRNNITTTESLSENQSQTTESTSDTSTTASGIGLSTSSRGDHSTSSQQSTTQDNFTESFNTTTTTTLINNATESSNYTIMSVTPNLSENGNVSVTDDVNVTFSQSNDTENSTIDDSTESFYTTTATLIKNESDIVNYTSTYSYPNSSNDKYMNVTIDENTTFFQSNNTVNSTIDSNLNQNVTSSKQETYLKNEADSNNTLMITVLIGTLSVGTLLFVAVIVVISKKIIDGWQKRHYSRIDYLVNGMYN